MSRPKKPFPAYCHRKQGNLAYVKFDGHARYLGSYDSPQSRQKYLRLLTEWQANGQHFPDLSDPTVADLFVAFWRHAKLKYTRDGRPSGELSQYRSLGKILLDLYGDLPAAQFGPRQLKACREAMIQAAWFRKSINRQVCRLRSIFRFAVSEELFSAESHGRLLAVEGLRKGWGGVTEGQPVRGVDPAVLEATLAKAPPVIADMARLQRITGMRSGELVAMRKDLMDQSGNIWRYDAPSKMAHLGQERPIFLGPKAQFLLSAYLSRAEPGECIFRPEECWGWNLQRRHAQRVTPMNQGNRPGKSNRPRQRQRSIREKFTPDTYRQAIRRACERAGVENWHPHQLRHSAATAIRQAFSGSSGVEAARVTLGHQVLSMTDFYAGMDMELAKQVAMQIG